ncbi:MAG: dihydroorotate dehydrogenase [Actinobacteria bacterium]|nr:dihydroorotate dehydrogenase [Actinomycetota bacterium]MDA2961837.1 dihydroorotate dehydrogenase [Actinomycetota bacterium]MDA2995421.1 dihydroorotate dehydrogenase [Actinomycetota bacterium]
MSRRSRHQAADVAVIDRRVNVGSITLSSPLMTASGTAGYGSELAPYFDLSQIGAVVTKSIAPYEWAGNPAPRVHTVQAGMINAVGLQGPGVEHWLVHELPKLIDAGASVVCSIWGRSVDDYALASQMLADAPDEVVAVEVNLSCPNLEGRGSIFAHDAELSASVMEATAACGRPRWAKLSPNTDRLVEIADAVSAAGAEAVTLVNTLLGLVFDPETARPVLGNGGGGVSGPAIHPIAVRAVADVRVAFPELPIVGVGGVVNGWGAAELMLAGAHAVQVGTATFANPAAIEVIQNELLAYAARRSLSAISQLTSAGVGDA